MPDYRLTTEDGDVTDTATLEHDQAAISWRSSRPFSEPSTDGGRRLRLEKHDRGSWVRIDPLGTSETT